GRGVGLEGEGGVQAALVVAVEVDLEHAADMRLVVGVVVELDVVDLDGAVVPRRVRARPGQTGKEREQSRRTDHHCRTEQPASFGPQHRSTPPMSRAEEPPPSLLRYIPRRCATFPSTTTLRPLPRTSA